LDAPSILARSVIDVQNIPEETQFKPSRSTNPSYAPVLPGELRKRCLGLGNTGHRTLTQ